MRWSALTSKRLRRRWSRYVSHVLGDSVCACLGWALFVLTGCSVYARVDTRPVEQRLADRPIPKFSDEDIRALSDADRSKPFRLRPSAFMRSCAPESPPVREMSRAKVNRVEGVIEAIVQPSGLISDVSVAQLVPEGLKPDILPIFRQSLMTTPCRFPQMQTALRLEIPFRMIVD